MLGHCGKTPAVEQEGVEVEVDIDITMAVLVTVDCSTLFDKE